MKPPIDLFCSIVEHLPELGRRCFLRKCCTTLGNARDLTEENPDLGALLRPPTIKDLKDRLSRLNAIIGLNDEFLIRAIAAYVIEALRSHALPTVGSLHIDTDLERIAKLEHFKQLPMSERPSFISSDEQLDGIILHVKNVARNRPAERDAIEETLVIFKEQFTATFTSDYWQSWLKHESERPRIF